MSTRTLQDVRRDYNERKREILVSEPIKFSQDTVVGFNIHTLIRNKQPHKDVYIAMKSDLPSLASRYRIAVSLHQDTMNGKRAQQQYIEKCYKINATLDVHIIKVIGESLEMSSNVITPNRLSMILTRAANSMYNRVVRDEDKAKIHDLSKIVNPSGMMHGFYPNEIEVEDVDFNSVEVKLLKYYLVTTIGFDAIAHVDPFTACVIAAFRCRGSNPDKLGLTKDLDDYDTVYNNSELASRYIQGVYTKTFSFGTKAFKVQEALDDKAFKKAVKKEIEFLVMAANEPTRARDIRIKTVATIFAHMANKIQRPDEDDDAADRFVVL